jgi:peptidoglycan/LPS O-acetylase OafA/YrhL
MLPVLRADPQKLPVNLTRFVRKRAFRILPPYFATLAGSLALIGAFPVLRTKTGTIWDDSLPGWDAGAVISHVLVVHNWFPQWVTQINGPLWSVATEWQIYFFFPLLLLPVWRRFGLVGTVLVAAALGYAPLLIASNAAMVAIPWYLLLFAFGMGAAAFGFSLEPQMKRLRERLPWRWLSVGAWSACAVAGLLYAEVWFALKPVADLVVGLATATSLVQLTSRVVEGRPSALLSLLESQALVSLGHFSYSLYLTHLPVIALCYFALRPLGLAPPAFTLTLLGVGAIASLATAYAFYLVVERRFIQPR